MKELGVKRIWTTSTLIYNVKGLLTRDWTFKETSKNISVHVIYLTFPLSSNDLLISSSD